MWAYGWKGRHSGSPVSFSRLLSQPLLGSVTAASSRGAWGEGCAYKLYRFLEIAPNHLTRNVDSRYRMARQQSVTLIIALQFLPIWISVDLDNELRFSASKVRDFQPQNVPPTTPNPPLSVPYSSPKPFLGCRTIVSQLDRSPR